MQTIEVKAQHDHVASLAKAQPLNALSELIWNALDADANLVSVKIQENGVTGTDKIVVEDDGHGLSLEDAKLTFEKLGGSWKKKARKTRVGGRMLHGKEGKGRFKAFSLGNRVSWHTRYQDNGDVKTLQISGNTTSLLSFAIDEEAKNGEGTNTGTTVTVTGIEKNFPGLSEDGEAPDLLTEQFALYLKEYPSVRILFRGVEIDPKDAEKNSKTYTLDPIDLGGGKFIDAEFTIVEWNQKRERKIYLCNNSGFTLCDVKAKVRLPNEHFFTAYLRSEYIAELEREGMLDLEDLNQGLDTLLGKAREKIRSHFREVNSMAARDVVEEWKKEGSYPYEKEPEDIIGKARNHVFDICALNVHEYLPDVRKSEPKTRKFTFRVLKQAIESSPESLQSILEGVLDLPVDKRDELAALLKKTTLNSMIEATKLVTSRLDFLEGFEAMLFEKEPKRETLERSQLHRILAEETWFFGEKFNLSADDESLSTVLQKHLKRLRPDDDLKAAVTRDDGKAAVIDLMLGRSIPYPNKEEQEFLVVELKRPSEKVSLAVKGQIESYAMAVAKDERFDKDRTRWTFIAIGNEMTDEAEETVSQPNLPKGFFHVTDRVKIGLMTWAQLIHENRSRHEFFRSQLEYSASRDSGVEYLNGAYAKYIPKSLRKEDSE